VTDTFAKKAYRTLLVAYREYSIDEYKILEAANNKFSSESDREVLEKDLTMIGIFAL
jgi:magnesium-transporting ATPase (P-type)